MNIRNSPYDRRRLTTWLLLLGVIPLPSIYGRRLQVFSWEHLNTDALARCIAAPILMLMRFLALAITLFGFNTLLQAQELRLIVLDVNEGKPSCSNRVTAVFSSILAMPGKHRGCFKPSQKMACNGWIRSS